MTRVTIKISSRLVIEFHQKSVFLTLSFHIIIFKFLVNDINDKRKEEIVRIRRNIRKGFFCILVSHLSSVIF